MQKFVQYNHKKVLVVNIASKINYLVYGKGNKKRGMPADKEVCHGRIYS